MSYVIAAPEIMTSAATDLATIGSTIGSATAAAASPTTGVLAAAGDEVSAAIAAVFSAHGQGFQALGAQAAVFHDQFVQALTAGAGSFVSAEAANVGAFTANVAQTIQRDLSGLSNAPSPALTAASTIGLVMGGSGIPLPNFDIPNYVALADQLYIHPNFPNTTYPNPYANGLFTPEYRALSMPFSINYPTATTGPLAGFPAPSTSVGQGMLILENSILSNVGVGNVSTVFGWSQSATISGLVMQQLSQPPFSVPSNLLQFVLVGDPNAPNGGAFERFVGLQLPSIGWSFDGATPSNLYPTSIYTLEYDGFADFPRYPINFLADANAALGLEEVHGLYLSISPTVVANAMPLPTQGPTETTYYMIPLSALPYPHNYLPLLQPLLDIPVVGKPLADLLQPDLTVLVNLGYGPDNVGWSTTPANVPTPLGLFPHVPLSTVANELATGAQQGVSAFVSDLQNMSLSSLVPAASSSSLPSLTGLLPALSAAASDPSATLTRIVNGFSGAASSLTTAGFQTADLVNAG